MAEYAQKEEEQEKEDEQGGDGVESVQIDQGSTTAADGSTSEGDFNIEMALGRDLLGDLGMDDDDLDGSCEYELPRRIHSFAERVPAPLTCSLFSP